MSETPSATWRASFLTGRAIIRPAVISIAVVKWLFGTVANRANPRLIPETPLTRLDRSVADGIKFIISPGSIAPGYAPDGAPVAGSGLPALTLAPVPGPKV